jgi:hypothetical protein
MRFAIGRLILIGRMTRVFGLIYFIDKVFQYVAA